MAENFIIMLQAMLDKVKSLTNIKKDIKSIEPKLKIKLKGVLDKSFKKDMNATLKSIKPKIKVDADTSQAIKKIKKLGQQKTKATVQATVDNSQVMSSLKETQKETKSLFDRFMNGVVGVNLVRMSVQKVTQAINEAITGMKELDKIKTNIQMVSGTSDPGVDAMMQSYNSMAKDLKSTTKAVSEAANEFLRMGESVANTNELIKSSQVLSKVGMIESSDAASYLISSLKGYKIAAGDSLDVVSKLTAVDLEAAVSAGGLAEAMSRCSNIANSSGTSMDRLIGYMATVGEVTQDSMSVIGNSFKSIYSRFSNLKLNRFIDDETGESLSDVESVLNKLGIQLRDMEDTYRDFDDVLDDVGNRWKDFTQVEQNAISVAFAGTMQRERFIALMNNYSSALKYSETAANSAGSAMERYGIYQDSIEAKTNELTAAMESLYTSAISEDLFSGIIGATTNVVEFIDKTNLLKGTLAGLVAVGISKMFVSMATGIITAAKSASQLTSAMALLRNGRNVENLEAVGKACVGLNDTQLRLVLSTKGLGEAQRLQILAGMGVAEAERQQTLATLGLASAENAATVSTFSFRGAMDALKVSIMTNPIGAIATAVSIATMVFSGFSHKLDEVREKAKEVGESFSNAKSDIDSYKAKVEELQAVLNDSGSSISDVTEARKTLMSIQDELIDKYGSEKSAIDLITEGINGQADAFDRLAQKQWQEAKNDFNDGGFANNAANFINGYSDNIDRMLSEYGDYKVKLDLSVATTGLSPEEIEEFKKLFEDNGMEITYGTKGTASNNPFVELSGNASEMHEKLLELQEMFSDANPLSTNNFRNYLTEQANAAKEASENYKEMYDSYILYEEISRKAAYKSAFNDINGAYRKYQDAAVLGDEREIAKAAEDYAKIITDAVSMALDSGDAGVADYFKSMYPELQFMVEQWEFKTKIIPDFDISGLQGKTENDVLAMLQTEGLQEGEAVFNSIIDKAKEYGIITDGNAEGIQEVLGLLAEWGILQKDILETELPEPPSYKDSLDGVQSVTDKLHTLMEVYDDVQDGEEFNWSSILNNDDFASAFESAGKAYDDFIQTVTQNSDDIGACQKAFDSLATSVIDNSGIWDDLTAETKEATIAMLEENGVVNASELVNARLAMQEECLALAKDNAALAGKKLSDTTWEEIGALLSEGEASDTTSDYLTALAISKMDVNSVKINTQDDVDQIIAIANAAGASTSYIQNLANALLHFKSMEFDTGTMFGKVGDSARNIMVKSTEEKLKQELSAQLEGAQLDSSQFYAKSGGTGGSGSGKSGKSGSSAKEESIETFDFIETAVKRVESAIERLKTRAEETFRSFTKRGREYKKAISEIAKEIDIQRKGYDAYIAKANSVGLEESWASQVRDGSINIADVSDDGLKERIKNYKEWYEKALECQEKLEELKKTQKELAREKIELLITKYEKLLSKLESTSKRIQNTMGLKETWGFSASAKDYTKLNKNAKSQIKNLINQNKKLKELQKTVTKGSEAWREYNERINSNNESIQELTQSMAENAIASANLAGQNAEAKNSAKDTVDEKTDAKLSTASTSSRKNSLLGNKAKNIDARQKNLQAAYNKTAKSRASYGNKILKANKKDVSKKNKKLFTQAIAKVKAGKLVSASTINGIVNALKSAKGKEYKELNALLSHCISYNANKNAEEENKLNLEMYALTAQEEKKSLRQEQLSNSLDANQSKADRAALSNAETTAAKNQNIDVQTRLSNANANAQTQAAKNAVKDRETAAGKASFTKEKSYKKLKDKKLKKRLKKAVDAIKAGKKIDSDSLKAVKEYCQKYLKGNLTYYYNCEAYNEAVENELSAKEAETLAKAQAYAGALNAKREKAANEVEGRDAENELHAATAKNQTSASAKNQYVDRQISNISQNASTYQSAYNVSVNDFNSAKGIINKSSGKAVINEIKTKFVSRNILIPADYLEKAYAVSNSFGLACSNYNEALEAMNAAKAAADLYAQTAKTEKAALALEKMENIDKDYGHKISVFEQRASRIDNSMDIAQAKGYQASRKYYERLTENEEKTNETLERKRKDLTDSLNQSVSTGAVTKFSDEWYEACGRIDDVTNAIEESAVSLAEFQKQMRQIDWDNFDYLESRIKNTISETDFLIGELSREDLASEDIGWMTDRGKAAAFLHAGNYESYRKQAEDYASEIRKINSELEKDPYNKELVDRKDGLLQSYRECIQAAQEEKYAVIDLYTQGYEALSGKLKNLISDYEELLDKEKDAFDYQKNIADKAKEIAGIRKQLEAYAGDVSEETRAKIQTLKVSLEEAEKDLQETQYDKYISDTKEMLSDLQDNFDEAIQLIVDSLAENFGKLTEDMEATAAETGKSIMSLMTGIGYAPTEEFGKLLEGTGIAASVSAVLAELKDFHAKMTAYADKIASSADADATADGGNAGTGANNTAGIDQAIINAAAQSSNGVPKGGAQKPTVVQIPESGDALVHGKDGQSNGKTDVLEEAGTSKRMQDFKDLMTANDYLDKHLKSTKAKRSELTDINKKLYDKHGKKILTAAQMKELAKKLGVKYDNQKSSGSLYKKLKSIGVKGFHIGSKHIPYDQPAFLGEEGDELHFNKDEGTLTTVGQGDMVFTDEMSKRLWEISQMPPEFIREKFGIPSVQPQTAALAPLPPSITENNQFNGGDVNINMGGIIMNGVNDKKEFIRELNNALATNRDTKAIMQHNTVCALGKNYRPKDVMRYVR